MRAWFINYKLIILVPIYLYIYIYVASTARKSYRKNSEQSKWRKTSTKIVIHSASLFDHWFVSYIKNNDIRHDTKNYNSSHEKTSRSSVMLEESYVLANFIFIFENVRFIFIQICIALLDNFFLHEEYHEIIYHVLKISQ